jgi:hypothetical protein
MLAVVQAEPKLGALFWLAIRYSASDVIAFLVRRGGSVNGCDSAGLTPLMLGAIYKLGVCLKLPDAGADLSLLSPDGLLSANCLSNTVTLQSQTCWFPTLARNQRRVDLGHMLEPPPAITDVDERHPSLAVLVAAASV